MKLNQNQPELILDLRGLKGSTRRAVSALVQTMLMVKHGFHWEPSVYQPQMTDAAFLHINAENVGLPDRASCPMALGFSDEADAHLLPKDARVFDARFHKAAFLAAVADLFKNVETTIGGVIVRVTRDSITMDATAHLQKVGEAAKDFQQTVFGHGH